MADRYAIERELGRGGMATVYLARDLRHNRSVALKVLHPELAYALGSDRFLREIEVAASLNHPHILPLFDSGDAAGLLYYVMPYVRGESLRDRLRREAQLPVDEAVRIAREVADALAYAHDQAVVHRDIKPENIMLGGGHALVADFGIARALGQAGAARLTETGLIVGTPAYMSPEQAAGEAQLDGRTDVYSLGCVLYELLAGAPPFAGPTAQAMLAQHVMQPVPPLHARRPAVVPRVEQAVLKALAKAPADRFATAREFGEALAGGDTLEIPAARRRSSRLRLIGAGAAALLLALVILAATLWRQRGSTRPVDPDVVAVAPFSVVTADPSLGYLREGMVDLLAAKLTGEGGPRAADPRSVLSAWRRASGSDVGELPRERAMNVAERLGAGQLLVGNVVGAPRRIVLNASVLAVPGGQVRAQTSVEGPADSLPSLVDRLTAKLLTLGAGEGEPRLSALTSTSLAAVRAYLEGQTLYRHGRYEGAITSFEQALQLDSTFSLAAVGLLAAGLRSGAYEPVNRGEALARAGENRLNPRDRAYLQALIGVSYTHTNSYAEVLHRAERFVAMAPDRVEAYAYLGEVLFNFGEMLGIPTAHARAAAAYRRALELDSTYAPAIEVMLLLSARAGDTATVRRMRNLYRAIDSLAGPTDQIRWRMAVALRDSAGLDSVRARFESTDVLNLLLIGQVSQYDGVDLEDAELAHQVAQRGESRGPYRRATLAEVVTLALNRGRPAVALRIRQEQAEAEPRDPLPDMNRVLDALYWDGDSAGGAAAVRNLGPIADAPSIDSAPKAQAAQCVTEQWRIAHGQLGTARRAIARLRAVEAPQDQPEGAPLSHGCAVFLDALLASAEKRPDAAVYFSRLDSLMLTGPPYRHFDQPWNLVIARFKEGKGDLQGALAAIRRRLYFVAEPVFLSTYLREEGRLAALVGDRTGAIRAYRHYLILRPDPDPRLRQQVDQVRADLADLLRETGR